MACPICKDGLALEESVLTSCGHVYHRDCLARWWREGGDCPLCRAALPEAETHGVEPLVLSADTLDDLLLVLAAEAGDAPLAAKILLCAAPQDAVFTHAVHATFHRLFDPTHTRYLPATLPRSPLITRLLLAAQPVIDALLLPPAFKRAKRV